MQINSRIKKLETKARIIEIENKQKHEEEQAQINDLLEQIDEMVTFIEESKHYSLEQKEKEKQVFLDMKAEILAKSENKKCM